MICCGLPLRDRDLDLLDPTGASITGVRELLLLDRLDSTGAGVMTVRGL